MSAENDVVKSDYGVTPELPTKDEGPERRIWRALHVAPDPHNPGHFYVIQELAGQWKKTWVHPDGTPRPPKPRNVDPFDCVSASMVEAQLLRQREERDASHEWHRVATEKLVWFPHGPEQPPKSRVIYVTFDEYGVMQNVYRDASQGRIGGDK